MTSVARHRKTSAAKLTLLWVLLAGAAWAASNPKATALAKDADRFYRDNKYREAAETLKQAYELDPNTLYLYNIARAWDQAGEVNLSLESYRQYVAQPSDTTQPELVKKANLAMDRLRTLMARGEADKKIQEADKKRLEEDKKKAEQRAEAEAKAAREQRAQFEEQERARREAANSTVGTKKLIAYIAGGATVAALGTSLVFAIIANGSRNAFRLATTLDAKTSLEATTRTQALVTDIMLLVGLATAATAIIIYPKGAEQPAGSAGVVSLSLTPFVGGGLATIGGTF